eukprot:CAMPEP_0195078626 /NCGR_PEP_ID=MMETSP0448-20130528/20768_1 /TAXON_ID=66468 /ORGANISM="Heterocapsa triquestra, Strain CCMP 448" /LENGTH=81 /DNA_ID=CAMNT_0040111381 /DNA_START=109 /DNA_END=350 /DNA_ORIENTATION=+
MWARRLKGPRPFLKDSAPREGSAVEAKYLRQHGVPETTRGGEWLAALIDKGVPGRAMAAAWRRGQIGRRHQGQGDTVIEGP